MIALADLVVNALVEIQAPLTGYPHDVVLEAVFDVDGCRSMVERLLRLHLALRDRILRSAPHVAARSGQPASARGGGGSAHLMAEHAIAKP